MDLDVGCFISLMLSAGLLLIHLYVIMVIIRHHFSLSEISCYETRQQRSKRRQKLTSPAFVGDTPDLDMVSLT